MKGFSYSIYKFVKLYTILIYYYLFLFFWTHIFKTYLYCQKLWMLPKENGITTPQKTEMDTMHCFQKKQCEILQIFYPSNLNFTQTLFAHSYIFPSLCKGHNKAHMKSFIGDQGGIWKITGLGFRIIFIKCFISVFFAIGS